MPPPPSTEVSALLHLSIPTLSTLFVLIFARTKFRASLFARNYAKRSNKILRFCGRDVGSMFFRNCSYIKENLTVYPVHRYGIVMARIPCET